MKKNIVIILFFLGLYFNLSAQNCNEVFTIYLVRHSEKDLNSEDYSDPPLTECGLQRSEFLNKFLSDVPLEAVYSTDYTRTKSTALPTANAKKLKIKEYSPSDLKKFSKLLIESKQDVLVVGHSNTTGVLAGILIDEEIGAFDLDIYNRIYQIVFYKNNGRLHLFHTSFNCD